MVWIAKKVPNGGACVNKFGDEMDCPADEKLSGPDCNIMIALAPTKRESERHSSLNKSWTAELHVP